MKPEAQKRDLLYRRAQGRKRLETFESKVYNLLTKSEKCRTKIDLQETDELIKTITSARWKTCNEGILDSPKDFFEIVSSEMSRQKYYVLIDDDWKYCGAILIKSNSTLNKEFNFDHNFSDELRFLSEDKTTLISIDYIHNGTPPHYETTTKRR